MSNERRSALLCFTDASADEGNRYARDLKDSLLDIDSGLQVQQRRDREDSQDFGATLVVVLGTTAINTLAHGIAAWLRRNAGARITVKKSNGGLVAEGLDSKDVAQIVRALSDAT